MIKKMNRKGFTLVELLTVMAVIAILAGLVLSTAGYVQKKAATSRAETERDAIIVACESYKTDNGAYPREAVSTDKLDPKVSVDPTQQVYKAASLYLYGQLTGDTTYVGTPTGHSYTSFKPNMLGVTTPGTAISASNKVTSIQDPFGYSYGYSTIYQANQQSTSPINPSPGFNPTFDLWSTAGTTTTTGTNQWIKNW